MPMTSPTCELPSRPRMRTLSWPWTTWALVTKSPLASRSQPVPRPSSLLPSASMVTVRLSAARAMSSSDSVGDGATTRTTGGRDADGAVPGTAVRLTVTRKAKTPASTTTATASRLRSGARGRPGGDVTRGAIVSHGGAPAMARAQARAAQRGSSTPLSASRRSARARCDTPSLAASSASPKVTPRSSLRKAGS